MEPPDVPESSGVPASFGMTVVSSESDDDGVGRTATG